MKIKKDIRKDIFINQDCAIATQPCDDEEVVPEIDMQQRVDDIFLAADIQIAKKAAKELPTTNKVHKWKVKISWSIIGFILFIIISLGFMGYKTYKYAANRWPGIREEIIRTYEDLQTNIINVDDTELPIEAYYQKQYMLVLNTADLRDLSQLALNMERIRQLQQMVENNETISVSLLEFLPMEKATQFVKIMIAEQKAKDSGEIVYVDEITDEEVQQFFMDIQKQQNTTED
ncbi:MAG: hypothetical protein IJ419_04730 [Agathobacter sp.]|nr:hypothetical protein [Agathobacter sp.]